MQPNAGPVVARSLAEPAAAIDPANPLRMALVAKDVDTFPENRDVRTFLMLSTDGGATWGRSLLPPPSLARLAAVGASGEGDAKVLFTLDGRLHVLRLYGELPQATPATGTWILDTVSTDGGATWADQVVATPLQATEPNYNGNGWDAPSMAYAADGTGYVTAQSNHIGMWRTLDGKTWSRIAPPADLNATALWPRVVAGPDGLVAVHAQDTTGQYVAVSRDHGATWEKAVQVDSHVASTVSNATFLFGDPLLVQGTTLWTAHAADGKLVVRNSIDGRTWSAPRTLDDASMTLSCGWQELAANQTRVAILWLVNASCQVGTVIAERLVVMDGNRTTVLVTPGGGSALPCCVAGNEYGGLAVSPNGTILTAWGEATAGPIQNTQGLRVALWR